LGKRDPLSVNLCQVKEAGVLASDPSAVMVRGWSAAR
jgi:hypothetical protein